jgi:hypothetical protein
MGAQQWRQTETVAWTLRDGPGRPPAGPPRPMFAALAVGLAAVFAGIMTTDALCPEHRMWVNLMAGTAFVGAAVALVGLLRRWTLAPFVTAGVCALGVGIGLVDAIHAPARGMVLAAVFGLLTVACVVASFLMVRLMLWDRAVARTLVPAAADAPTLGSPAATSPVGETTSRTIGGSPPPEPGHSPAQHPLLDA